MIHLKDIRRFGWNGLIGVLIFLPVFVALMQLNALLVRPSPFSDILYRIGDSLMLYLIMMIPSQIGILVYTSASFLIPSQWTARGRRVAAILLSPLVPFAIILLGLPTGIILWTNLYPTVIAAISFGLLASIEVDRIREQGRGHPDPYV